MQIFNGVKFLTLQEVRDLTGLSKQKVQWLRSKGVFAVPHRAAYDKYNAESVMAYLQTALIAAQAVVLELRESMDGLERQLDHPAPPASEPSNATLQG